MNDAIQVEEAKVQTPAVDTNKQVDVKPVIVYTDIEIQCQDCPTKFIWTAKEQEIYARYKYKTPKRCKPCRVINKERIMAKKNQIKREPNYR